MKAKKGKIFHLEDNPEWIDIIEDILGDDYEIYSAHEWEEAVKIFTDSRESEKSQFNLSVIDISIKRENAYNAYGEKIDHESDGLKFIETLIDTYGESIGNKIIILSGQQRDDSWVTKVSEVQREYRVLAVFDKGTFVDEIDSFKNLVDKVVASASGG